METDRQKGQSGQGRTKTEQQEQEFRDRWGWQEHSHPRKICLLFIVAMGFIGSLYHGSIWNLLGSVALVGVYLFLSYRFRDTEDRDIRFLLLMGDEDHNRQVDLRNALIDDLIETKIIDRYTKNDQVEIEVVGIEPVSFHCRFTQQGRSIDDLEKPLKAFCPTFNAVHCVIRKDAETNTSFTLTYYEKDVFADRDTILKWGERSGDLYSLNAVPMGIDVETGDIIYTKILASNMLCGGITRSGKSVCITALLASLSMLENVAIVAIDPKRTEFRKFQPRLSCYVRTQEEADVVLTAMVQEMERRYELLEMDENFATKLECFDKEMPFIVLLVDELSYLLNGEDKDLNASILASLTKLQQVALACGISIIGATQKPSIEAMGKGSSAMRDSFIQRVCFKTATAEQTETILGRGSAREFPAEQIPKSARGYAYASTEHTDGARLMRSFYLTDKEAYKIAEQNWQKRIRLDWLETELELYEVFGKDDTDDDDE